MNMKMMKTSMNTCHPYIGEKGNKFNGIHYLNFVKACHSKIFGLVLIAIC